MRKPWSEQSLMAYHAELNVFVRLARDDIGWLCACDAGSGQTLFHEPIYPEVFVDTHRLVPVKPNVVVEWSPIPSTPASFGGTYGGPVGVYGGQFVAPWSALQRNNGWYYTDKESCVFYPCGSNDHEALAQVLHPGGSAALSADQNWLRVDAHTLPGEFRCVWPHVR